METNIRNKCKAYTSLEQSKKLAEILPIESADMEYIFIKKDNVPVGKVPFVKDDSEVENSGFSFVYNRISCWSLAALLGVLPNSTDICKNIEGRYYVHGFFSDNPVDACVDAIKALHELNLL